MPSVPFAPFVKSGLLAGSAFFAALLCGAAPARALSFATPPVGYVGPVANDTAETPMPPVGYTGPAPRAAAATVGAHTLIPPVGYIGPVGAATVAATPNAKTARDDARAAARKDETLITAQRMRTDDAQGLTIAEGKVEIVRGDYILQADRVTYNTKTGVMAADGHVALTTPTGEVEFAEHQEISGDMKQAFVRKMGILFPDNSRMAAATAQRYDERYTVAEKAMFTACNVCRDDPDRLPLWQVRAGTITHDKVAQEIYYRDATLDFAGVPVMYTPYMSSPDPTVKRRQGFLSPTPGYSPNIGAFVRTPYYFDIAPDKDMTVAPTFSTTDKAQVAMQYRERFVRGDFRIDGSFTKAKLVNDDGVDKGQQWRGHVVGKFAYDLTPIWRAGTDIQYVSDKSYLHRYNISSSDQMVSRAYLEGFKGRNYAAVNSYYFQDLRADKDAAQPWVLPSATVSALGQPGQTFGGRWSFDASTLVTQRDNSGRSVANQGPNTRRLSLSGGWQRQFLSGTGLVTTAAALLRTDSYWANHVVSSSAETYDRAMYTRAYQQGSLTFRYPMARNGGSYQHLLEPIVSMTAAPNVRSIAKQPIEDSYTVEFDETNLFSANRFTGNDLIEGGSRVTYGVRNAITMDNGARIDIFGGQSYNFTTSDLFPEQSGLNGHASDYVGRFDFAPVGWFNVNYGFRLRESDLSPRRQDAIISTGVPAFRPSARYIEAYQTDTSTGQTDRVRQITFGFSSALNKYWTLHGSHTQAFDPQPGPRGTSAGVAYIDECYAFGLTASHDHTSRADISSGTSVIFHFFLKNLGGLNTDSTSDIQFPSEFRQTE